MSNWIRLSERTPEVGQLCIIYGPYAWGDNAHSVGYGEWYRYGNGSERFSIADGEYGTGIIATHWQPLPPAPIEDEL